jgi:hypothetical protein
MRKLWFAIMIVVGLLLGGYYAWLVNPARNTKGDTLSSLRADYKTDYVLMVAELYQNDKNPALAASRLTYLSSSSPERIVQEAILKAAELGYSKGDVNRLARLSKGLEALSPTPGVAP